MLKVKQVVETEVELPAPDTMTLVWRNPKFDIESLLAGQDVKIKDQLYSVEDYSVYQKELPYFCGGGKPDTYLHINLEKINVCK